MVNVDLYSAIITKVSNALNTLISGEQPGFQTLSKGLAVLLCAEVVQQRVILHFDFGTIQTPYLLIHFETAVQECPTGQYRLITVIATEHRTTCTGC